MADQREYGHQPSEPNPIRCQFLGCGHGAAVLIERRVPGFDGWLPDLHACPIHAAQLAGPDTREVVLHGA